MLPAETKLLGIYMENIILNINRNEHLLIGPNKANFAPSSQDQQEYREAKEEHEKFLKENEERIRREIKSDQDKLNELKRQVNIKENRGSR